MAPDRLAALQRAFDEIGYLQRGRNLLNVADPTMLARIEAAVDSGDPAALRKILSDNIGLSDAPRVRVQEDPYNMPVDPRPRTDDQIVKDAVRGELGLPSDLSPATYQDAHRQLSEAGGAEELLGRLRATAPRGQYMMDLLPDNSPLFSANTGMGGGGRSMDVMPGAGIPSSPGTGLIPSGPRGLSAGGGGGLIVPPGRGLTTTGGDLSVQGMESPAPRGLPAPNQPRIEGPGQRRIEGPNQPRLESPDVVAERRAMGELEDAVNADRARRSGGGPKSAADKAMPAGQAARFHARNLAAGVDGRRIAAGIGAGIAGAGAAKLGMDLMYPPGDRRETMGDGEMSTADLAAETSPPPRVMTEEPAPLSPRDQAHALQRKLNEMRAAAGGEVPEAQAMRREIQRLFDISDAQANAAARTGKVDPAPTNNPLQQARSILAALNSGAVPANQRARMQAEMQRLYRLADEQANARTAAPRRAG